MNKDLEEFLSCAVNPESPHLVSLFVLPAVCASHSNETATDKWKKDTREVAKGYYT